MSFAHGNKDWCIDIDQQHKKDYENIKKKKKENIPLMKIKNHFCH